MAQSDDGRIYCLDVLRGLTALVTLLWHYQHFFFVQGGHLPSEFKVASQPLYAIFSLFYVHGHRRVDMFFVLSGFVFFAIYFSRVNAGKIGWQRFTWLRLSRLYPLHLATLLIVALGQMASISIDGNYLVYQFNDLKHFTLQVLFASDWGFQDGYSFNAPVWSVSVEVLLYVSFYVFAAVSPNSEAAKAVLTSSIIAISYFAERYLSGGIIAHAALCFYCGGAACLLWQWFRWRPGLNILGAVVVGAVGATSLWVYVRYFANLADTPILGAIVFPCIVLELALLQGWFTSFGRSASKLGDLTYALLLVHFPIQLATLLACKAWHIAIDFTQPAVLLAFASVSMGVAAIVHYRFELPCQTLLRNAFATPERSIGKRQSFA